MTGLLSVATLLHRDNKERRLKEKNEPHADALPIRVDPPDSAWYRNSNATPSLIIDKPCHHPLSESALEQAAKIELAIDPESIGFIRAEAEHPNRPKDGQINGGFMVIADNIANRVAEEMLLRMLKEHGEEIPLEQMPDHMHRDAAKWLPVYIALLKAEIRYAGIHIGDQGTTLRTAMGMGNVHEELKIQPDLAVLILLHCARRHDVDLCPIGANNEDLAAYASRVQRVYNVSGNASLSSDATQDVHMVSHAVENASTPQLLTLSDLQTRHCAKILSEKQYRWENNYLSLDSGLRGHTIPTLLKLDTSTKMRTLAIDAYNRSINTANRMLGELADSPVFHQNIKPTLDHLIDFCQQQIQALESASTSAEYASK